MSEAYALGEVIAERGVAFTRSDGSAEAVTVRIGKPTPSEFPDEWICPYQIEGFGRTKTFYAAGVDSVQALLLTLQTILPEQDHLAKREEASYSWLDIANAGFPDYRLSSSYQKHNPNGA